MSGLVDYAGAPWDYQAAGAMELAREEARGVCECIPWDDEARTCEQLTQGFLCVHAKDMDKP